MHHSAASVVRSWPAVGCSTSSAAKRVASARLQSACTRRSLLPTRNREGTDRSLGARHLAAALVCGCLPVQLTFRNLLDGSPAGGEQEAVFFQQLGRGQVAWDIRADRQELLQLRWIKSGDNTVWSDCDRQQAIAKRVELLCRVGIARHVPVVEGDVIGRKKLFREAALMSPGMGEDFHVGH